MAAEDACEGLAPTDPGAEQAALRPHRQGHHGMSSRGAPSLFGVHSKFRTAPDSRSPTVPRCLGAFWYQPSWAPSSLPAALAQVSGCSRRLPPAQFLPPDSARRDGAGLVSRTRGAPNLSLLSLCKGLLGTSLRNGPTQGLWLGTPVKGVEHQNKYGRTK